MWSFNLCVKLDHFIKPFHSAVAEVLFGVHEECCNAHALLAYSYTHTTHMHTHTHTHAHIPHTHIHTHAHTQTFSQPSRFATLQDESEEREEERREKSPRLSSEDWDSLHTIANILHGFTVYFTCIIVYIVSKKLISPFLAMYICILCMLYSLHSFTCEMWRTSFGLVFWYFELLLWQGLTFAC